MFLTEKQVLNLAKKLNKNQNQKSKQKVIVSKEQNDSYISQASSDDIFNEMKKLPFTE